MSRLLLVNFMPESDELSFSNARQYGYDVLWGFVDTVYASAGRVISEQNFRGAKRTGHNDSEGFQKYTSCDHVQSAR